MTHVINQHLNQYEGQPARDPSDSFSATVLIPAVEQRCNAGRLTRAAHVFPTSENPVSGFGVWHWYKPHTRELLSWLSPGLHFLRKGGRKTVRERAEAGWKAGLSEEISMLLTRQVSD